MSYTYFCTIWHQICSLFFFRLICTKTLFCLSGILFPLPTSNNDWPTTYKRSRLAECSDSLSVLRANTFHSVSCILPRPCAWFHLKPRALWPTFSKLLTSRDKAHMKKLVLVQFGNQSCSNLLEHLIHFQAHNGYDEKGGS